MAAAADSGGAGAARAGPPEARAGFLARAAAALVRPRLALAAAERQPGRTASDAVTLLLLVFAAAELPSLVAAGWLAAEGELTAALAAVAGRLVQTVTGPLVFVFAAGVLLAALRRSIGIGFDLACVALVPVAVGLAAASLVQPLVGAGAAWVVAAGGYAFGVALVALAAGKRRPQAAGAVAPPAAIAALALLLLGLFAAGAVRVAIDLEGLRPLAAGAPAPGFSLPRIGEGGRLGPETVDLESLRGRVLVVDFWAAWCAPCLEAMPVLERIHRAFADRGVEMVSVNTEGPEMAAEAFAIARRLAPSALLVSDDGRVADLYQVTTIPHLVIIDRDGTIRRVDRGFQGAAPLERALAEALGRLTD